MNKIFSYRIFNLVICFFTCIQLAYAQQNLNTDTAVVDVYDNEEDTAGEDNDTLYAADSLIYRLRPVPPETIKDASSGKGFYYRDYFDSLLKAKADVPVRTRESVPLGGVMEVITWVAVVCILGFLLYKLVFANSILFARNRKNKEAGKILQGEAGDEDTACLVQSAIERGDYRSAVRYLFLQTIRNLDDRNFIRAGKDKTNYQYITETRKYNWIREFEFLCLRYDYIWYGEYPVSRELFDQLHFSFKEFNKKINR